MRIAILGPPRCWKTSLSTGLEIALGQLPGVPAPVVVSRQTLTNSALPNTDPLRDTIDQIESAPSPLVLIDPGDPRSAAASEVCRHATHAILVTFADQPDELEQLRELRHFAHARGLAVIAEIQSHVQPAAEHVAGRDGSGCFRAVVYDLECVWQVYDRPAIRALAEDLASRLKETGYYVRPLIEQLAAAWQTVLSGCVTVEVEGSLVSGTLASAPNEPVEVDIAFLAADPHAPGLLEQVQRETGLRYKKTIEVNDWPCGLSRAHVIEGYLDLPELGTVVRIKGCLRNPHRINWHLLYPKVFSPAELEDHAATKRRCRKVRAMYKEVNTAMRLECRTRAIQRGLLVVETQAAG